MAHGYQQREELRRFQLVRRVSACEGGPIDIVVDFLMPRDAEIVKNIPPLINEFAVPRADGADLALRFYQMVAITGSMPAGGANRVEIAVCSIPALLAMKGHAVRGRYKQKDAYDIYYCICNYPDGIASLAHAPGDIFVYFPREQVLDAGSILKPYRGNMADADVREYPKTLRRLQRMHLKIRTVIAGDWSAVQGPDLIEKYWPSLLSQRLLEAHL